MSCNQIATIYLETLTHLSAENLHQLEECLDPEVVFSDPFHRTVGREKMIAIFEEMFLRCKQVEFTVEEPLCAANKVAFRWRFQAVVPILGSWQVTGMSLLEFNSEGLVQSHEEYWDSLPLLLKIPILGCLLSPIVNRLKGRQ